MSQTQQEHANQVRQTVSAKASGEDQLRLDLTRAREEAVASQAKQRADADATLALAKAETAELQDKFSAMIGSLQRHIAQLDAEKNDLRAALETERSTTARDLALAQTSEKSMETVKRNLAAEHQREVIPSSARSLV